MKVKLPFASVFSFSYHSILWLIQYMVFIDVPEINILLL